MQITINGEAHNTPGPLSILGLLHSLEIDPERVAIELDRQIVKAKNWDSTLLAPGAQLEIVQFVGGG